MSSTTQDTFDSRERHWDADHLTLEKPGDTPSSLHADVDRRECWCTDEDCHCRITVGPDGREYGHHPDCQHHCWDGRPEANRWDGVEV